MILDANKVTSLLADKTRFGFDDDTDFQAAIDMAAAQAKLKYIIPAISSSLYDEIDAKAESELSDRYNCIGWAEVYFTAAEFLQNRGQVKRHESQGSSETYTQAGITRNFGAEWQMINSGKDYLKQGYDFMRLAGYTRQSVINRNGVVTEWCYDEYENIN